MGATYRPGARFVGQEVDAHSPTAVIWIARHIFVISRERIRRYVIGIIAYEVAPRISIAIAAYRIRTRICVSDACLCICGNALPAHGVGSTGRKYGDVNFEVHPYSPLESARA